MRGDFSRLNPLFDDNGPIVHWFEQGLFASEPDALNEALTCACFNGRTKIAELLLNAGLDPAAGTATEMSALHWAADRGNLDTVKVLLERGAPLEVKNQYGGTVLGFAVWSAINKLRPSHMEIISVLVEAGANVDAAGYPTGDEQIDALLSRGKSPR